MSVPRLGWWAARAQHQALQRQIKEQTEMHAARMAEQQRQYYALLQQARHAPPLRLLRPSAPVQLAVPLMAWRCGNGGSRLPPPPPGGAGLPGKCYLYMPCARY